MGAVPKIKLDEGGFTLIEGVVSIAIFAMISLALINLFDAVFKNIRNNRAILSAHSVALSEMETVRGMSYENVKTDVGFYPPGPLPQEKKVTRGGIVFTVITDITFMDDPFDLLGEEGDSFDKDYKLVRVRVEWKSPVTANAEKIVLNTTVVPPGLEGLEKDKGGIYASVFNKDGAPVAGATVKVTSATRGFSATEMTDINGNIFFENLEPATDYKVEATREGYNKDETYLPDEENQFPEIVALVVPNKLTKLGFENDLLAHMKIRTVNFKNPSGVAVNADAGGAHHLRPSVALAGETAWVAFEKSGTAGGGIYLQKMQYNAALNAYARVWTGDLLLKGASDPQNPKLKMTPQGELYLLWHDSRSGSSKVYLQRLDTATGAPVGGEFLLSDATSAGGDIAGSLDADQEGNLFIVWEDHRGADGDVYVRRFHRATQTVGTAQPVSATVVGEQKAPQIVVDRQQGEAGENRNNVFVVWQSDSTGTNANIILRKFKFDGSAGEEIQVNQDPGGLNQYAPAIASDGEEGLFVVWADDREGQPDIYMQKVGAVDGSLQFSGDKKVNDDKLSGAWRLNPQVAFAAPDNKVYVNWEDSRNGPSGYNAYAAKLDTEGNRLWEYDMILGALNTFGRRLALAVRDDGAAVSVWEDSADTISRITLANYVTMEEVAQTGVKVKISGSKIKGHNLAPGSTPENQILVPVPKFTAVLTSNASGYVDLSSGLEFDSYTFEVQSPCLLKSVDVPSPVELAPAQSVEVVMNVNCD